MSTVNYSVPEDVKEAFNRTFKGRNKSAIIADLMLEAVEREERRLRHQGAADRIMQRHGHAPSVSDEEIDEARKLGRP